MANLQDLKGHLERLLPSLQGDWVYRQNNYERSCASAIEATFLEEKSPYYDCIWKGICLELKKGKNTYWLDLVRYSEYLLQTPKNQIEVITLFMCYREQKIIGICGVTTENLIKAFNLSTQTAKDLLRIAKEVSHQLQAKGSLNWEQVCKIAEFNMGKGDLSKLPEIELD